MIAETVVLAVAVAVAVALAGWSWLVPVVIAGPLVAVEFWFDIRSRGRRLIPELCGAIGISAVAASIVIAAGQGGGLAAGLWLVLAARAVGGSRSCGCRSCACAAAMGRCGRAISPRPSALPLPWAPSSPTSGCCSARSVSRVLAAAQFVWVRRAPMPAKQIGLRQMGMGLALVVVTAVGVLW